MAGRANDIAESEDGRYSPSETPTPTRPRSGGAQLPRTMDARQRVAVGALGRPRAGRGRRADATLVRPGGVALHQPARLADHAQAARPSSAAKRWSTAVAPSRSRSTVVSGEDLPSCRSPPRRRRRAPAGRRRAASPRPRTGVGLPVLNAERRRPGRRGRQAGPDHRAPTSRRTRTPCGTPTWSPSTRCSPRAGRAELQRYLQRPAEPVNGLPARRALRRSGQGARRGPGRDHQVAADEVDGSPSEEPCPSWRRPASATPRPPRSSSWCFFLCPPVLVAWMSVNHWPLPGPAQRTRTTTPASCWWPARSGSPSRTRWWSPPCCSPSLVQHARPGVGPLRAAFFLPGVVGFATASLLFLGMLSNEIGPVNPLPTRLGVLQHPVSWVSGSPGHRARLGGDAYGATAAQPQCAYSSRWTTPPDAESAPRTPPCEQPQTRHENPNDKEGESVMPRSQTGKGRARPPFRRGLTRQNQHVTPAPTSSQASPHPPEHKPKSDMPPPT